MNIKMSCLDKTNFRIITKPYLYHTFIKQTGPCELSIDLFNQNNFFKKNLHSSPAAYLHHLQPDTVRRWRVGAIDLNDLSEVKIIDFNSNFLDRLREIMRDPAWGPIQDNCDLNFDVSFSPNYSWKINPIQQGRELSIQELSLKNNFDNSILKDLLEIDDTVIKIDTKSPIPPVQEEFDFVLKLEMNRPQARKRDVDGEFCIKCRSFSPMANAGDKDFVCYSCKMTP